MTTNPFLNPRRDGVFVVKLLAAAFCFLSMSLASAAETNEQAVLAAHEHRRTATLAGDAAAVGSMMTDDFTVPETIPASPWTRTRRSASVSVLYSNLPFCEEGQCLANGPVACNKRL